MPQGENWVIQNHYLMHPTTETVLMKPKQVDLYLIKKKKKKKMNFQLCNKSIKNMYGQTK